MVMVHSRISPLLSCSSFEKSWNGVEFTVGKCQSLILFSYRRTSSGDDKRGVNVKRISLKHGSSRLKRLKGHGVTKLLGNDLRILKVHDMVRGSPSLPPTPGPETKKAEP